MAGQSPWVQLQWQPFKSKLDAIYFGQLYTGVLHCDVGLGLNLGVAL